MSKQDMVDQTLLELPPELNVFPSTSNTNTQTIVFTDQDTTDEAMVTGRWLESTMWLSIEDERCR